MPIHEKETVSPSEKRPRLFTDFRDLVDWAVAHKFHVTSTTGGRHSARSAHYARKAIDVRTRDKTDAEIETFIQRTRALGIIVRDERRKPPGQLIWSGPHLHLELPR